MTTEKKLGAPRCPRCFPGKSFDYDLHRELRTLGYPKYPKQTADMVVAALKKAGAKK
jgi:hypothetical protein